MCHELATMDELKSSLELRVRLRFSLLTNPKFLGRGKKLLQATIQTYRISEENVTCLGLRPVSLLFSVCNEKLPQTISCLRFATPFLFIVLICQVLVMVSFAYSQGPATMVPDQYVLPVPGDLRAFSSFIEFVGNEDDRIQKAAQGGKAQTTGSAHYATDIPVATDEVNAMLATLLDAYRRDREVDARLGCDAEGKVGEHTSLYGPTRASKVIGDESGACSKEKFLIAEAAWLSLKDELGADSFRRFVCVRASTQLTRCVCRG